MPKTFVFELLKLLKVVRLIRYRECVNDVNLTSFDEQVQACIMLMA